MEAVEQAYEERAAQYIELFGTTARVHAGDLALIARHLSMRPGIVLDVGCGPGHLTVYLRTLDVDAIGIDLVPSFIEHARATHPDGWYQLGSMHQLPVPDHAVAAILAWYSLIHEPPDDLDGVLDELRRAIAPAGVLVVGSSTVMKSQSSSTRSRRRTTGRSTSSPPGSGKRASRRSSAGAGPASRKPASGRTPPSRPAPDCASV